MMKCSPEAEKTPLLSFRKPQVTLLWCVYHLVMPDVRRKLRSDRFQLEIPDQECEDELQF